MKYHLYRRPNKKTGAFWMDVRIDGVRYREPLGTRDRGEAGELMHKTNRAVKDKGTGPGKTQRILRSVGYKSSNPGIYQTTAWQGFRSHGCVLGRSKLALSKDTSEI